MTLTTATTSSAGNGSANLLLFDDSLSVCTATPPHRAPQHARDDDASPSRGLPVQLQLDEAKATINRLVETVDHLRLELDHANARLAEEAASADRFAAENLQLQSDLVAMREKYDEAKLMFRKVRRAASYLKEDALSSDRECVELRLEVEALRRERDEYRNQATKAATAAVDEYTDETSSYSAPLKGEDGSLSNGPIYAKGADIKRCISIGSVPSLFTADTSGTNGSFNFDGELASLDSEQPSRYPSSILKYNKTGNDNTEVKPNGGETNTTPLAEVALVESTSRTA